MDNKDTSNFLQKVYAVALTDYLRNLNIPPVMEDAQQAFYNSPFSQHPYDFLKVDKVENKFYDSALEKSGSILEFGMLYNNWTLQEVLSDIKSKYERLTGEAKAIQRPPEREELDLKILSATKGIEDPTLQNYLGQLRIPLEVANRYCKQLEYEYYGEKFKGIGFENNSGGYAIKLPQGKLHTEPVNISSISGTSGKLDLYQDFTDYLNVVKLRPSAIKEHNSIAILHDLSLFENARPFLEQHKQINLYLHNTEEGKQYTAYAQFLDAKKYRDFSQPYKDHGSLTELCIATAKNQTKDLKNQQKL